LSGFRGDYGMNCETGNEWLKKAADNGWSRAEFTLFQTYYNGYAPAKNCPPYPQDKVEAIKWLRRAADHGDHQAQSMLAVMLIRGNDMEQNKSEAEKLLRNAAEHGSDVGQNDLGFTILNGDIISTNPVEAAMWFRLAVSHSTDTNVVRRGYFNLAKAMSRLTVDQQNEAEKCAANFQPVPVPEIMTKVKDWEYNPAYKREDGQIGH
jgi:TPR repeat protein